MPVATQKTDTGLTQGLLKVLHKQVGEPLNCLCFCAPRNIGTAAPCPQACSATFEDDFDSWKEPKS